MGQEKNNVRETLIKSLFSWDAPRRLAENRIGRVLRTRGFRAEKHIFSVSLNIQRNRH